MSKLEFIISSNSLVFGSLHPTRLNSRNYGGENCLRQHSCPLRLLGIAVMAIIPFVLVSCGGGSQPAPRGTPPSSLSYPQSTINAVVGTPIPAETPTVTGGVTSYSCSPALPAGLALDTSVGTISGMPTAPSATATYNIKASNSYGSTTTSIQITVSPAVPPPSQLIYPQTSMVLEVGQQFASNIPSYSGSVASFSISPSLPAGLTLDAITGAIYGVPSASSTSSAYNVTASNQGGSTTAGLTILVNPALVTLLDLGAVNEIFKIQSSNGNVVVQDRFGNWVLINYASATKIAAGEQGPEMLPSPAGPWPLDMEGSILAVGVAHGLEVRSAMDGHLLAVIASPAIDPDGSNPPNSWWRLASDGSYICAGSSAGLTAWSTSGNVLLTRSGDYSRANVFAGPGRIQVALGAAGASVIETVLVSDGSSSVGPAFSGSFNTWFLDGNRFLTNLSNSVWTYDTNSAQQSFLTLPGTWLLGGEGNWIWTIDISCCASGNVTVYPVGSSQAAGSFSAGELGQVIASGTTIGLLSYGTGSVEVIDLSGASLSQNTYAVPTLYNKAYGATSASVWLVGNMHGTVVDGASLSTTPRFLTQGTAFSMAGSTSNVVVAVANGTIYSFNPSIITPQQSISFSSSQVELSADGTVLAAAANTTDAQYDPDRTLNVYALPAATLTYSWPYQYPGGTNLFGMSLATGGSNIGQSTGTYDGFGWHFLRQVTAITGGPVIWSDTPPSPTTGGDFPSAPDLSPNGDLIAAASDIRTPSTTTTIYNNGTAATAVPGFAVGWIDDTQLLVDNYVVVNGDLIKYSGCTIYSPTGAVLSSPTLPEIGSFQTVSPGLIYTPDSNTIYSTSTGTATWTSTYPYGFAGATAGGYVVFLSGARVVVQSQ